MTHSELRRALADLRALVEAADVEAVDELRRRLDRGRLRVLVVGEAKRGKSTLINALLGRSVLPAGVTPLTAIATTLVFDSDERVDVTFRDGSRQTAGLDALPQYVTERDNPGNARGVRAVTVRVDAPLLGSGVELVDTPGTGSVFAHNTTEAVAALERMDVALFVLTADPPVTEGERLWLREVRRRAVRVFCVLNKADYLDVSDLAEAVQFTRQVIAAELGDDAPLWPLSARRALVAADDVKSADAQWRAFAADFLAYLEAESRNDLYRSVAARGAALARKRSEEAAAARAALDLDAEQLGVRLHEFRARLQSVTRDRVDAIAVTDAAIERLVAETAYQGERLAAAAGAGLVADVSRHLGVLAGRLQDVEAQALEYASERIREVVDGWRAARTQELTAAVAALDQQLRERVDEHVRAVREAASELFELKLPPVAAAERLVDPRGFRYAFGTDVGQAEALATALRTHLPGKLGRSRVEQYVRARTLLLLDRQVGRVRADFTERLRETRRQLRRAVDRRYDDGAGHLAAAVEAVARQRDDSAADTVTAQRGLKATAVAAESLAARFDALLSQFGPPSQTHRKAGFG